MAGFVGARIFTTFFHSVVVVQGEIHFHHFWFGIGMVALAGWLGIAWRRNENLDRIYAVLYGLGAGFIGDEVGLLLTLGNYYSQLTLIFFVLAVSFAILVILLVRYRNEVEKDFFRLKREERLVQVGIFVIGFSTIFLAFGAIEVGTILAIAGIAIALGGWVRQRR
jgi:small-conductance mechanosensitive channel